MTLVPVFFLSSLSSAITFLFLPSFPQNTTEEVNTLFFQRTLDLFAGHTFDQAFSIISHRLSTSYVKMKIFNTGC